MFVAEILIVSFMVAGIVFGISLLALEIYASHKIQVKCVSL